MTSAWRSRPVPFISHSFILGSMRVSLMIPFLNVVMSSLDIVQAQIFRETMSIPKVTILSALSYQYADIVPALLIAADDTRKLYSKQFDIGAVPQYRRELYSCDSMDDASIDLISSYYHRQRKKNELVILLSPTCKYSLQGTLGSEWNIPVVSLLATPPTEVRPYPTFIASAPVSNIVIYSAVIHLLQRFSWKRVFLLCDTATTAVFYRNLCAGFKLRLKPPEFTVVTSSSSFDSSSGLVDYDRHLAEIASKSRVVFLLSGSNVVRTIMIQAHRRNMTGSEYIYLFPYPFTRPSIFAPLKWNQNGSDDKIALDAFRSLILMTFDRDENDNTTFRTAVEHRILSRQQADNVTIPTGKLFQPTMAAYEAVMVIATVVNEVLQHDPSFLLNGTAIVERMLDRKFKLPTGAVYYSPAGQQYPNMAIKQINPDSEIFEEVLVYDADTFVFNTTPDRNFSWKGNGPPLNEPLCGYTGEKCVPVPRYDSATIVSIAVPLLGFVLLGAMTLAYYIRRLPRDKSTGGGWWCLEAEKLKASFSLHERKSVSYAHRPFTCSDAISKTSYLPELRRFSFS